jgi:hypothetical protein
VAHRDECDYGLACPKFEDKRTRIRRPIDASDPLLPSAIQSSCVAVFLFDHSSALSRIDVGTSRPSALAVVILSTVSYFTDNCIGRSAGFSLLRMRST